MKIYTGAATDVEYQVISIYHPGDMRNLSKTMVSKKVSLIIKDKIMKSIMILLMVILFEVCGYGWMLGEENEQLKEQNAALTHEISELKHSLVMAEAESSKLKWDMMLTKAGVPDEE